MQGAEPGSLRGENDFVLEQMAMRVWADAPTHGPRQAAYVVRRQREAVAVARSAVGLLLMVMVIAVMAST